MIKTVDDLLKEIVSKIVSDFDEKPLSNLSDESIGKSCNELYDLLHCTKLRHQEEVRKLQLKINLLEPTILQLNSVTNSMYTKEQMETCWLNGFLSDDAKLRFDYIKQIKC